MEGLFLNNNKTLCTGEGRKKMKNVKILIVDDDEDLLDGQKLYLTNKGYEVKTALSMEEGLKIIENYKPDIIIVDLMMEHYDTGFVFCKKIKENPVLKDVPIIMQTAAAKKTGFTFNAKNPEAKKWMKVDEILTKPVPLTDLEEKIKRYLKK